ncbi:MAG: hypothetical protein A2283_03265, partial [Lentisphaerae bacterium RIFOXYA12_FULL_48_11]
MKIKSCIRIIITVCFMLSIKVSTVYGGVSEDNMQFLKINPSAREAGIGDGYTGLGDSVNAVFYNPAGLINLSKVEISLMHMMYVAETSYEYGALVIPVNEKLKIGIHAIYLNYGVMTGTLEDNTGMYAGTNGSFTPYNLAAGLSFGYEILNGMGIGGSLKYAVEDIAGSRISGIFGDIGMICRIENIGLGASLCNMGGTADGDKPPAIVRAGVTSKFKILSDDDLLVAFGANYVLASGKVTESIGTEYWYEGLIGIRGSYGIGHDAGNINIGAGVRSNLGEGIIYGVDYNLNLLG